MNKISDVTFVLIYIISVSIATLLMTTQPNIISENTIIETDTLEQKILIKIFPSDCLASNTLSDQYSCSNLYDGQNNFWSDDHNSCSVPTWIRFYFEKEIYLEFIVLQQIEDPDFFNTRFKMHEYRIQTSNFQYYPGTLDNDTYSQWIDINEYTTSLEIEVLSTHLPVKYNNLSESNNCVLQEISFYGRNV